MPEASLPGGNALIASSKAAPLTSRIGSHPPTHVHPFKLDILYVMLQVAHGARMSPFRAVGAAPVGKKKAIVKVASPSPETAREDEGDTVQFDIPRRIPRLRRRRSR